MREGEEGGIGDWTVMPLVIFTHRGFDETKLYFEIRRERMKPAPIHVNDAVNGVHDHDSHGHLLVKCCVPIYRQRFVDANVCRMQYVFRRSDCACCCKVAWDKASQRFCRTIPIITNCRCVAIAVVVVKA